MKENLTSGRDNNSIEQVGPRPLMAQDIVDAENRGYDIGRRHGKEEMKIEMTDKFLRLIGNMKEEIKAT